MQEELKRCIRNNIEMSISTTIHTYEIDVAVDRIAISVDLHIANAIADSVRDFSGHSTTLQRIGVNRLAKLIIEKLQLKV